MVSYRVEFESFISNFFIFYYVKKKKNDVLFNIKYLDLRILFYLIELRILNYNV